MKLLNGARVRRVAEAVIRDPAEHTTFDAQGAVRSVQAADLTMPAEQLEAIWSPMHLERLARTYWKYLSRVTLGLIRVVYTPTERAVVLIGRPFVLLRFHAPEYTMDDRPRRSCAGGSGTASSSRSEGHEGDGFLEIEVRRCPRTSPAARRSTSRSRSPRSIPRSRSGSRAGSTRTRSRASTCWSPTASCARSPGSSSRSRRSAASRRTPATARAAPPVNVGDTPWPRRRRARRASRRALALLLRRRR